MAELAALASPQVVQSGIQGATTIATSDTGKEVVQGVWSGTMAALGAPIAIFGLILVMIGLFIIYGGGYMSGFITMAIGGAICWSYKSVVLSKI